MATLIIFVVTERISAMIEEQIRMEINLVGGVEKELLYLSDELKRIRAVLDDADRRAYKDESIRDWLTRLEYASYEMDDVLDEWEFALLELDREEQSDSEAAPNLNPSRKKVCSFVPSSYCLCFKKVVVRRDIAFKLRYVKSQLDQILEERDKYSFLTTSQTIDPFAQSWRDQSTSFVHEENVYGRDYDKEILLSKIMADGACEEESGIRVISIVGLSGIGKTTLAQLVYNDSRVKDCYPFRIWICVSDPFDQAGIANRILQQVEWRSPDTNQSGVLLERLRESISGKKFLLVLDDVWIEDYEKWKGLKYCLECGGAGSKILVTTRNGRVADMMGADIHHLGFLSEQDCWSLLSHIALSGRSDNQSEKFLYIGRRVVRKCWGLPLAIKILGSLLRFKTSLGEWKNVLTSEIWQSNVGEELLPHFLLCYNELSPALKLCFSYCAIFPKNYVIDVENLIEQWMALGYLGVDGSAIELELRGRDYFDDLAMCSLFQNFTTVVRRKMHDRYLREDEGDEHVVRDKMHDQDLRKDEAVEHVVNCTMHDIVHDFALSLMKGTSNGTERAMNMSTCKTCSPSLVSRVKKYRSLFYYKELSPYICDCLVSLRVLSLRECGLESFPEAIAKLIHLRYLDLSCSMQLSVEDLKAICKLLNLKTLLLSSCCLKEIPKEIEKLIQLRHLDLSFNTDLKELPSSICDLRKLRRLDIEGCNDLCRLPERIERLINLKHLHNHETSSLEYPQGLSQLTGLHTLAEFNGKLSYLKELNQLRGSLTLVISRLDVHEAREAQMNEKEGIQTLKIVFGRVENDISDPLWMDVMNALEPHRYLEDLVIMFYEGIAGLPGWISSPFNLLRSIKLRCFPHLSRLPSLGKLPFLEKLTIERMYRLVHVGREFMGLTATKGDDHMGYDSLMAAAAAATVCFPKLTKLKFLYCNAWEEWEDITAEESATVSVMPCLAELTIVSCEKLAVLPHRLLRKAWSLRKLKISASSYLSQQYNREEVSAWKYISHIPSVQL